MSAAAAIGSRNDARRSGRIGAQAWWVAAVDWYTGRGDAHHKKVEDMLKAALVEEVSAERTGAVAD